MGALFDALTFQSGYNAALAAVGAGALWFARRPWPATVTVAVTETRFCVASFTSDWLYPTSESRQVVHALNAVAANVSFVEIESDKGHDAFLLDEPELHDTILGFIGASARARGL